MKDLPAMPLSPYQRPASSNRIDKPGDFQAHLRHHHAQPVRLGNIGPTRTAPERYAEVRRPSRVSLAEAAALGFLCPGKRRPYMLQHDPSRSCQQTKEHVPPSLPLASYFDGQPIKWRTEPRPVVLPEIVIPLGDLDQILIGHCRERVHSPIKGP